ncbi:MAG TPA: cyclase family protein [Thermoanaerobaculia bacterium]|nr:cyclase family protein [Thermoanaerobaculia bacterium]
MPELIDLSHAVEHGMVTYRGLPAPAICDFWSRESTRGHYAPGVEFQIGRIDMVANTGTYLDTPFHRYPDGHDLADLPLARCADLPGVVVRAAGTGRAVGPERFAGVDLAGRAVLVHTGWDRHWGTEAYFEGHPFLTAEAAELLAAAGAALVGIDSLNIDATDDGRRTVHSTLLAAEVPIVEHMTGLDRLPDGAPFRFSAVPVKVRGMGSFPVRAYARLRPG